MGVVTEVGAGDCSCSDGMSSADGVLGVVVDGGNTVVGDGIFWLARGRMPKRMRGVHASGFGRTSLRASESCGWEPVADGEREVFICAAAVIILILGRFAGGPSSVALLGSIGVSVSGTKLRDILI